MFHLSSEAIYRSTFVNFVCLCSQPVKSNKKGHNLLRSFWRKKHREIIYDVIVVGLYAAIAFSEKKERKKEKEEKERKEIGNRFSIYFLC